MGEILPVYNKNKNNFENFKKDLLSLLTAKLNLAPPIENRVLTNLDRLRLLNDNNKIAAIYAIDRNQCCENGFITNWEARENGSIAAHVNASKYAYETYEERLSYVYVNELRTRLSVDRNEKEYAYSLEKSKGGRSFNPNSFCRNGMFGIPNDYRVLADFIGFRLGYLENPPAMIGEWFWLFLLYEHPTIYRAMHDLIPKYQEAESAIIIKTNCLPRSTDVYEEIYKDAISILTKNDIFEDNELFAARIKKRYNLDKYSKLNTIFNTVDHVYSAKVYGILCSNDELTDAEAEEIFNHICEAYNQETKNPSNLKEDEKYESLITMVKAMEMMHWHADWNMRTWLIVMHKECKRLNLSLTWLDDPNCIDWLTVSALTQLCKKGTINLDTLLTRNSINSYNTKIGTYESGTLSMDEKEKKKLLGAIDLAIKPQ